MLPYSSKGFSAADATLLNKLDLTPAGVGFNKFKPNLASVKYFCLVYSSLSGPALSSNNLLYKSISSSNVGGSFLLTTSSVGSGEYIVPVGFSNLLIFFFCM